jgi:hypothetical protein
MLAERGFSPSQIAAAAKGARQQGVTVPDYLIGNGYVTAALPPHRPSISGLPFISGTIPLHELSSRMRQRGRGHGLVQTHVTGPRMVIAHVPCASDRTR